MEKKGLKFGDLLLKDGKSIVPFSLKHKGDVLAIHILNGYFIAPEMLECNTEGLHDFKLQMGKKFGKFYFSCADISVLFYLCYNFRKMNNLLKKLGYPPMKKTRYWSDQHCFKGCSYVVSMENGNLESVETYKSSSHRCEEDEGYTNEKAIALLGLHLMDIEKLNN